MFPPEELRPLVEEIATLLTQRKQTISVAETVTLPYSNTFPSRPLPTLSSTIMTPH